MRSQYPIYETLLKLYPKQYRQHYSAQMVQTLTDMLGDQPSRSGRFLVWLRAGSELPINLLQQNFNAFGEAAMSNFTKVSNKRLLGGVSVGLALIVIVLGVAFYKQLVPAVAGLFYRHGVTQTLQTQNRALADPMAKLLGSIPSAQTNCYAQQTENVHVEVGCQSTMQGYVKLDQTAAGKARILKGVSTIEAGLSLQGYKGGSNGVTLGSLVGGTYDKKDYSPDAYYEKVIGNYDCVFDTMISYANPQPPAIHVSFNCTRTFNVFGAPSHEVYRSHDGTPAIKN